MYMLNVVQVVITFIRARMHFTILPVSLSKLTTQSVVYTKYFDDSCV